MRVRHWGTAPLQHNVPGALDSTSIIMIIMEPQIKHTFLAVVYFCKQQKTGFILSHLLHQIALYRDVTIDLKDPC